MARRREDAAQECQIEVAMPAIPRDPDEQRPTSGRLQVEARFRDDKGAVDDVTKNDAAWRRRGRRQAGVGNWSRDEQGEIVATGQQTGEDDKQRGPQLAHRTRSRRDLTGGSSSERTVACSYVISHRVTHSLELVEGHPGHEMEVVELAAARAFGASRQGT